MTRQQMPAARVPADRLTPKRQSSAPLSLLAAAIALALGTVSIDANALSLGRINLLSALGEPLRAEIDVSEISAAEADGLKVNIASIEAFRAAGVPYNSALSDVRTSVQRRADGRYVIRLSSTRSVSDPFIDLLLEATWSSGRVVRDYTMLLDPPGSRQAAAPIAPIAPQISSGGASSYQRDYAPAPEVVRRPRPVTAAVAPPPAAPVTPARPRAAAPVPVERSTSAPRTGDASQQVRVQPGDTASKIAGAYKPAEISLDQMLVALLRANPDAFIGGNVNRIKAGAVLELPDATQAGVTPAPEARRTVIAQSRDFGDYRRRLADNAPSSRVDSADRQASGRLQANVEDRNAAAASPDKLTIAQARAADERLAQARQAQESNARVAELSKNITELNRLQAAGNAASAPVGPVAPVAPGASGAPAAGSTAAAPAPSSPTGAQAPTPAGTGTAGTPSVAGAASGAALPGSAAAPGALATGTPPANPASAATAPALSASAAVAAVAAASAATAAEPAPATPAETTTWYDELLANPLWLAIVALVLLLLGWVAYRLTGRRRQDAADSVFLESRLPKDSFFAASGGESVDTKNRGNSIISSLSYSPSQLDAGDVDPVAEADVYLAYGRDLQAEEILREALRVNPERTAIHLKLLEIHAKRRDLRAYEALAADVQKLTGGSGNDWNRVVEMGKELDPGNPLYEVGVRPAGDITLPLGAAAAAAALSQAPSIAPPAPPPVVTPPPPAFVPSVAPLDFDLDMDKPVAPVAPPVVKVSAPAPTPTAAPVSASLPPTQPQERFVQTMREPPRVLPTPAAAPPAIDLENDFNTAPSPLDTLGFPASASQLSADNTEPVTLRAGLPDDSGFIEFDMSAMSGLPPTRDSSDTEPGRLEPLVDEGGESPHAIKLSLARELQALGDVEGARSLVEEVEAESSGELRAQAKQLLAQLG